ncbi:MAG: GDP-mannose 4,6-dehydratase, partial [Acidobacteriota bacterium]
MSHHVLITGGAGFIGSHLSRRFLEERGARLTVLDDFNDYYAPAIKRRNVEAFLGREDYRLVEGDIRDAELVEKLFTGRLGDGWPGFDGVVHLAARAGVRPSLAQP